MQQQVLKSRGMQMVERQFGQPLESLLRELYERDGLTVDQVAERLGVTKGTVSRWMARVGIEARFLGPRKAA